MPSWNSRGLRGSMLEEALNMTNEQYRKEHLALVQKIPTPITPINIDKEHRHITLAYFEQKSTVDYIGNVQGVPICFDAKECVSRCKTLLGSCSRRRTQELFASRTGSGLPDTHIKPNIHSLFGCFKPRSGVPSGILNIINAARVL